MSSSTTITRPTHRYALVLGLLTAMGPFGIDMYLPALPDLGRSLGADAQLTQATLASYFLALGLGQLVAGPVTDMLGRKRPILVGLALFLIASIGSAVAPSVGWLISFRLLQGLGVCVATVAPRAVVRDLYSGGEAARLMTFLLTVYSVSPVLAPAFGSTIAAHLGWRSVFAALALAAAAAIVAVKCFLPETRPPSARVAGGVRRAVNGYIRLLTDSHFLRASLMASFALGSFFVYVAHSSFVLQSHFGVSASMYSVLFSLNAIGLVAVSRVNGLLARTLGLERTVKLATRVQATIAVALLLITLAGVDHLGLLVAMLVLIYSCNGILIPSLFVLAMDGHASLAGSASALIGTFNFAGGALIITAASHFANGQALPMVAGVACCTAIVCIVGAFKPRRNNAAALAE